MELYRSSYALDEDVCQEISPFSGPGAGYGSMGPQPQSWA